MSEHPVLWISGAQRGRLASLMFLRPQDEISKAKKALNEVKGRITEVIAGEGHMLPTS